MADSHLRSSSWTSWACREARQVVAQGSHAGGGRWRHECAAGGASQTGRRWLAVPSRRESQPHGGRAPRREPRKPRALPRPSPSARGPAAARAPAAAQQPLQQRSRRTHLRGGGHLAGADGPYRLVGDHHLGPVGDLVGQGLRQGRAHWGGGARVRRHSQAQSAGSSPGWPTRLVQSPGREPRRRARAPALQLWPQAPPPCPTPASSSRPAAPEEESRVPPPASGARSPPSCCPPPAPPASRRCSRSRPAPGPARTPPCRR